MKKLTPILINKAIDLYAGESNITHSAVAERLGITNKTLMKLRKKPDFWHSVYAEFCIHMEGELPDIVRALLRECKAGSVQAIRLLLEWAGKLNKTLDINISSPFEKWLTANGKKIERGDNIEDVSLSMMSCRNEPQIIQGRRRRKILLSWIRNSLRKRNG